MNQAIPTTSVGGRRDELAGLAGARLGFTLVELLVTIGVIAILAAIVLGALQRASTASRIVHSKSTIAKLNASLLDRWDSYRNRRLPVDPQAILQNIKASGGTAYLYVQQQIGIGGASPAGGSSMAQRRNIPGDALATSINPPPPQTYPSALQIAAVRLLAIRELQQYEMPQGFADFIDMTIPVSSTGWTMRAPAVLNTVPPVATTYLQQVNLAYQRGATPAQIFDNESAECLYMILTIGSTDGGMFGEQLPTKDVGDVDADGLLEFQDSWVSASTKYPPVVQTASTPTTVPWQSFPWWAQGKRNSPISFIRWPAGFFTDNATPESAYSSFLQDPNFPTAIEFSVSHHDPFDPLKVDVPYSSTQTPPAPRGYQILPLIYSAGPDGVNDLYTTSGTDATDPYFNGGGASGAYLAGTPADTNNDGTIGASDNITNHELDTRIGR